MVKAKGHDGSFNFEYHQGTISNAEWERIQKRARKANPRLLDSANKDAIRRAKSANKQWEKRLQN